MCISHWANFQLQQDVLTTSHFRFIPIRKKKYLDTGIFSLFSLNCFKTVYRLHGNALYVKKAPESPSQTPELLTVGQMGYGL